ncbi:hypothetical protein Misp03_76050 [Microbispora sp. NBRC 16548]|nr:hypothetical protein Misp03_76050 [Microbispora sp. NBRC 16548]
MTEHFYSDRTFGPRPRTLEEITANVWRGLVSLVHRRVKDGSLALEFPDRTCPDGSSVAIGTDEDAFYATLLALIPQLESYCYNSGYPRMRLDSDNLPSTRIALDVIDFIAQRIATPSSRSFHGFFGHEHIWFDGQESIEAGRETFRRDIELLFSRNGIAFTIGQSMQVQRLSPLEVRPLVNGFKPSTGDSILDEKLLDAITRYQSRVVPDRVDAVEKLWDAFERLKTLELGDRTQKSASIQQLIEAATSSTALREQLTEECKTLTKIGNNFAIRHHEHGSEQLPAPVSASVDYLFTRLLALISFLLRQTGRL